MISAEHRMELSGQLDDMIDLVYNQAIDDFMDSLKNEWTIDSILCATDRCKLMAIFMRVEGQLKE